MHFWGISKQAVFSSACNSRESLKSSRRHHLTTSWLQFQFQATNTAFKTNFDISFKEPVKSIIITGSRNQRKVTENRSVEGNVNARKPMDAFPGARICWKAHPAGGGQVRQEMLKRFSVLLPRNSCGSFCSLCNMVQVLTN